jgi:hypothetical protein
MPDLQYQTTIDNVREVILIGAADPAFWQRQLAGEGLTPFLAEGAALVTITALSSTFRRLRFEEMTVAISVCEGADKSAPDGFFLAHAFNSRRLFALAERVFFRTPYFPGRIAVHDQPPAAIRLTLDSALVIDAAMSGARDPKERDDELWEGVIYLPRRLARNQAVGERFFARMGGQTAVYPFLPASDRCHIRPRQDDHGLQWLADSRFSPAEWRLRRGATHARSRTFRRTAA